MKSDYTIKTITGKEIEDALKLAWEVFMEYEAPDYPQEGVDEFHGFITEGWKNSNMTFYGAVQDDKFIGMLALRPHRHVSLFFVAKEKQGKGVGKALFEKAKTDLGNKVMTVNAAPYAVEIYHHMGFEDMTEEKTTNGIRYTPMRFGKCPCQKSGECPRSVNCFECREHHKESDKPRPCDRD